MNRLHRFPRTKTGKVFIALFLLLLGGWGLLFTPWGNRALSPSVGNVLASLLGEPIALEEFTLRHDRFELRFHDTQHNTVSSRGGFSLLTMQMYAYYRITAPAAGGINPLRSPLEADGALRGGFGAFDLQGEARLFDGSLRYLLQFRRLHLANLRLSLADIAYEPLMHELDYPSDTDTRLSGSVDLSGIERRNIAGTVRLASKTRQFSPTPIREETNESFDWRSLLADEQGTVRPFDVNVTLSAAIEHAGILEQWVKLPLSGPLEAHGSIQGNERTLYTVLRSSVARSDTALSVRIPDLDPTDITLSMHHADIGDLFTLFCLQPPILGTGYLNARLNQKEGVLTLQLQKARTVPAVLKRDYNITQPPIRFDASIRADLKPHSAHYRASLRSDLGRMEIDRNTTHDQMLRDLLNSLR